jgi:hypothetical protein
MDIFLHTIYPVRGAEINIRNNYRVYRHFYDKEELLKRTSLCN